MFEQSTQDPPTTNSGVNYVIAHRDAALAYAAYGEIEKAWRALKNAEEHAIELGLSDQIGKIRLASNSLQSQPKPRARRHRMNATTLVFIHGINSNGRAWDTLEGLVETDERIGHLLRSRFEYTTGLVEINPLRRFAEISILADLLHTHLTVNLDAHPGIILVGHSLGGLIIQRMLEKHRQEQDLLAKLHKVILFACPNLGSNKLSVFRSAAPTHWNRQEAELRPFNEGVAESHRVVALDVAETRSTAGQPDRIPFQIFLGSEDDVVLPASARGSFENALTIPGDHGSLIRPTGHTSTGYLAFSKAIRSAIM